MGRYSSHGVFKPYFIEEKMEILWRIAGISKKSNCGEISRRFSNLLDKIIIFDLWGECTP